MLINFFCFQQVESSIKAKGEEFMWNPHLGFILTCPSNLGTGLRGGRSSYCEFFSITMAIIIFRRAPSYSEVEQAQEV